MAAGNVTANNVGTWTDLSGFGALRASAKADEKSALPVVAKQFEAIFTQMMLKSMRAATPSDGLMDSQGQDQWTDLYDHQLSVSLSKGKGLGIADMLVKQLGGSSAEQQLAAQGANASSTGSDWQDKVAALAGSVGAVGTAVKKWVPQDIQQFVKDLAPHAIEAAKKLGVSVRVVLAQAALETQYGKHMPKAGNGDSSFNLFGIKAGSSWDGGKVNVPTVEYQGGVAVRTRAAFRAYDSPSGSFSDYADLIANSPRYAQAVGKGDDAYGYAKALVAGGYATDPSYASKVAAIANSDGMRQALEALKQSVSAAIP
ncbi:flagellar assembly peptidoglycan hydrolase FlgJ [Pinirhizobacter soli]|uniref:flagellar assembly peptidoglycan hydrolase FlgJ n=1 Tax=Pinirhizobacter soli TaxID=2786953 RepID=UPI002029C33A|nr:flagellar assembly peptidoglycan hydrolase FlgJ [Pinirhizobacter soli]